MTTSREPWAPIDQQAWIGRRVRVYGCLRTIVGVSPDVRGEIRLDAPVKGFTLWNLNEVTVLDGPTAE